MTAETDRARDATGVRRANLPPRTMNFKFYNYGVSRRKALNRSVVTPNFTASAKQTLHEYFTTY